MVASPKEESTWQSSVFFHWRPRGLFTSRFFHLRKEASLSLEGAQASILGGFLGFYFVVQMLVGVLILIGKEAGPRPCLMDKITVVGGLNDLRRMLQRRW
jgi:hypothetical protein